MLFREPDLMGEGICLPTGQATRAVKRLAESNGNIES